MSRDATLDEFATGDAETDAAPANDDAAPQPVEPTMSWTPEGVACSRCGDEATRVWYDDGDAVCPDCKPW